MKKALRLAKKGLGFVHPNPLVGAVLVRAGKIIGRGAHEKFGSAHAEVNAIKRARSARGATLYVTLEPCVHFGKTPPCVDFILKSGIKKVVIATTDSNPLVSGKGVRALKKKGVEVTLGVLQREALELNRDFNHWIKKKMPYVTVKAAQSLDGKIATARGESRWITAEKSRRFSHVLRSESDAVLVGVETLLKDDPLLSVRLLSQKKKRLTRPPMKVILDSRLRTPETSRIFSSKSPGPVLIATTKKPNLKKQDRLKKKAEILQVKEKNGRVDLKDLLRRLARRGVCRVLIEGGGEVIADAISQKLVNEVYLFIAPKIIGGNKSINAVGGEGVRFLKQAVGVRNMKIKKIGSDLMIHGEL